MASRSARAARADRRRSQPARAQGGRPETRVSFLRVRMRPNVDLGRQGAVDRTLSRVRPLPFRTRAHLFTDLIPGSSGFALAIRSLEET
jgi:hypothetical protein